MELSFLKNESKRIRVILMSDIHYCNEWYGVTPEIKREMLCADFSIQGFALIPYRRQAADFIHVYRRDFTSCIFVL